MCRGSGFQAFKFHSLDSPERDISLTLSDHTASIVGILGCEQLLRDQLILKAASLGALAVGVQRAFVSGLEVRPSAARYEGQTDS